MYACQRVRVKICCISSLQEAKLAIEFGADALGLVGRMPSGPGVVSDFIAAEIAMATPPPVATFMLTSEMTYEGIMSQYQVVRPTAIQLVDEISEDVYLQLRKTLPTTKLVQVIHVIDERSIEQGLMAYEYGADSLLLDSGNPTLAIKELGGTGRIHNWRISRKIVKESKIPVFLAGGLSAHNVRQAIDQVSPFGLDICSGVRVNGLLDMKKLDDFMSAVTNNA